MIRAMKVAFCSFGIVLLASAASAAQSCPRFLVVNGYGDLCSPSAWMAFEHQDNRQIIKRRLDRNHKGAKVKYRPPRSRPK